MLNKGSTGLVIRTAFYCVKIIYNPLLCLH
jgi:hypothetical protein